MIKKGKNQIYLILYIYRRYLFSIEYFDFMYRLEEDRKCFPLSLELYTPGSQNVLDGMKLSKNAAQYTYDISTNYFTQPL